MPAAQTNKPKKANAYASTFEANPKANELFVTSDKQVFVQEQWAKSHAKQLEDKAIEVVKRDEAADETEAAE